MNQIKTNQSVHEAVYRSVLNAIYWSAEVSVNQSVSLAADWSVHRSVYRSVRTAVVP